MHIRFYLLLSFCFCLSLSVKAQQFTVKGVISKKSTPDRVGEVLVKNLKTNTLMLSDDLGWFTIQASVGDTLLFTKIDYTPQKVVVYNQSDMPVYLQPIIQLGEVKIVGQSKKQELNQIMGDYRKQGTFYAGKPPVLSFLVNPVTGLYELFGKTPGRARRFAAFSKGEMEQAEVNRRYNTAFVRQYTNLPSDSLARRFMNYYTPSFEDMKHWTDYDLIKATQRSFDYYSKSSDKKRLEEINVPTFLTKPDSTRLGDDIHINNKKGN